MEDTENRIVIRGCKAHRALVRSIEHQIQKWIHPERGNFQVEIDREEDRPYFQCSIRVLIGNREWISREVGKTIQESLSQGLKHLRPTSLRSLFPRRTGVQAFRRGFSLMGEPKL